MNDLILLQVWTDDLGAMIPLCLFPSWDAANIWLAKHRNAYPPNKRGLKWSLLPLPVISTHPTTAR